MSYVGRNTRGQMERQRLRNAPDGSWYVTKRVTRELLGPSLPNLDGVNWHPKTRDWYNAIRRSDVAGTYEEHHWEMLLDAALLKNAVVTGKLRNGRDLGARDTQGFSAEIRQTEFALALTPEAERKLKMIFVDPESPAEDASPKSNVDYRQVVTDG